MEPDVFAAYAHLQPGSITVKVGDKVKVGQHLANLGNSGTSSGPHLHFGLLDQANLFVGRSLPYVLQQFTLVGTVNFETSTGDHLVIAPESREVTRAYPLLRRHCEHPRKLTTRRAGESWACLTDDFGRWRVVLGVHVHPLLRSP